MFFAGPRKAVVEFILGVHPLEKAIPFMIGM